MMVVVVMMMWRMWMISLTAGRMQMLVRVLVRRHPLQCKRDMAGTIRFAVSFAVTVTFPNTITFPVKDMISIAVT